MNVQLRPYLSNERLRAAGLKGEALSGVSRPQPGPSRKAECDAGSPGCEAVRPGGNDLWGVR